MRYDSLRHDWLLKRLLLARREGELAGPPRRWLARHLDRCAACRATLRQWEEAERRLQAARPGPVALPTDTAQALFARALLEAGVQPDGRAAPARWHRLWWPVGTVFLGAALLLAIRTPAPRPAKRPAYVGMLPTHALALQQTHPVFHAHGFHTPGIKKTQGVSLAASSMPEQHQVTLSRRRRFGQRVELYASTHRRRRRPRRMEAAPLRSDRQFIHPVIHPLIHQERNDADAVVAQASPMPLTAEGRLVVVVTHAPSLPIEVTHALEAAPGFARATCFRRDSYGSGIWRRCMISRDDSGADTVQMQSTLAIQGPQPEILVVKTAMPGAERAAGLDAATDNPQHDTATQSSDMPLMPEQQKDSGQHKDTQKDQPGQLDVDEEQNP